MKEREWVWLETTGGWIAGEIKERQGPVLVLSFSLTDYSPDNHPAWLKIQYDRPSKTEKDK